MRPTRTGSVAALALVLGCATGCFQKAEDLPYRTGTLDHHPNGTFAKGRLVEPTELEGLLLHDWIHRYEDGTLYGGRLAEATTLAGRLLPADTMLWFDETGVLESCWLGEDTELDGLPCRGGGKIMASFWPDGGLRAVFLAEDIEVQGVPCAASVFSPVRFHADGTLAECELSGSVVRGGSTYEAGTELEFDPRGEVTVADDSP